MINLTIRSLLVFLAVASFSNLPTKDYINSPKCVYCILSMQIFDATMKKGLCMLFIPVILCNIYNFQMLSCDCHTSIYLVKCVSPVNAHNL